MSALNSSRAARVASLASRAGLAALLIATASCAGSEMTGPPEPKPVASIMVTPGADTLLALGRTRTYVAVARDADGVTLPDAVVRWSSSDTLLARVDSLTGVVTAVANGTATIRARSGLVQGTASATIIQVVAAVEVTPGSVELAAIGGTQAYTAVARDSGNAIITGVRFLWGSSDPSVAQVDSLGVARIVGPGTTTISATGRGVPAYAQLAVTQNAAQLAFSVQPSDLVAGVPFATALEVEVRDANGMLVQGARIPVTLALQVNAGSATLHGSNTVMSVGGIATFSGIWVERAGSYNIIATGTALVPDTSGKFDVDAAAPASLSLELMSGGGTEVGSLSTLEVQLLDAFDNPIDATYTPYLQDRDDGGLSARTAWQQTTMLGGGRYRFVNVTQTRPVGTTHVFAAAQIAGHQIRSPELDFDARATISRMSLGRLHSCATAAQGVLCWGQNSAGSISYLGGGEEDSVPTLDGRNRTVDPFVQVVTLQSATCALTTTGEVLCWGGGMPYTIAGTGPGGLQFVELTSSELHMCGRLASGAVWCWGEGTSGQLGNGASVSTGSTPVQVSGSGAGNLIFASIDAGGYHTCGVTVAGRGYCWGANNTGQFGDSTTISRNIPTQVAGSGSGGRVFTRISAGGDSMTCGITTVGTLLCWGYGVLGIGPTAMEAGALVQRSVPTESATILGPSGSPWIDVSLGFRDACAIRGGRLYCWGEHNAIAETYTGSPLQAYPKEVDVAGRSVLWVESGSRSTCARNSTAVYCWGSNVYGRLGIGSTTVARIPVPTRIIQ